MQQKELSQMHSVSTPDKIKNEKNKLYPTIIQIRESPLHDTLVKDYTIYKASQARKGALARVAVKICGLCKYTLQLCRQIWKEIMPEFLRGRVENELNSSREYDESKEQKCFEEFKKKRSRFFVIVFDDQSSQDQMQQAYQKASFITPEGRGITIEQLVKETSCATWEIKSWSRTKRYSILFFKFDLFEHLLFFGNLTKQMIDNNKQQGHYFQNFKTELNSVYDQYETIEREFVSSYMEKEDRLQLSLE